MTTDVEIAVRLLDRLLAFRPGPHDGGRVDSAELVDIGGLPGIQWCWTQNGPVGGRRFTMTVTVEELLSAGYPGDLDEQADMIWGDMWLAMDEPHRGSGIPGAAGCRPLALTSIRSRLRRRGDQWQDGARGLARPRPRSSGDRAVVS